MREFDFPELDGELDAALTRVDSPLPGILAQFEDLDTNEIYLLHLALKRLLPPIDPDKINVQVELAEHLRAAQGFMAETLISRANTAQKGSAMTSVSRSLSALIALQDKVYNIERVKNLERALTLILRAHPDGEDLLSQFRETFKRLVSQ